MNKLEEQIRERFIDYVSDQMHENAFADGAQFVIDLELDIEFALWLNKFDDKEVIDRCFDQLDRQFIRNLRSYWIENIYGK